MATRSFLTLENVSRKDIREIPGLTVLFLPPYSPQLNPAERFFENWEAKLREVIDGVVGT